MNAVKRIIFYPYAEEKPLPSRLNALQRLWYGPRLNPLRDATLTLVVTALLGLGMLGAWVAVILFCRPIVVAVLTRLQLSSANADTVQEITGLLWVLFGGQLLLLATIFILGGITLALFRYLYVHQKQS
jgi:hypothetical protein